MTGLVAIYNMALSHLGTKSTVAAVDENSEEARTLSIHYSTARDSTLRGLDWNFARRIAPLAPVSITIPAGFGYAYSLPSLCARFRGIWTGMRGQKPIPYSLLNVDAPGGGGDIKVVLTQIPEATAWYTKIVEDTALFDPLFVSCLAWRLAAEVALPITSKADILMKCEQKAQIALTAAAVENANEDFPAVTAYTPDALAVRGYECTSGEDEWPYR